jgi:hypothetical protein
VDPSEAREFVITTIGLALVYVLLWLAYIGIHALENWPCLFSELSPGQFGDRAARQRCATVDETIFQSRETVWK